MTIVVWDGKTLAADRLSETNGCKVSITKLYKHKGYVLSYTGNLSMGKVLVDWFKEGCDNDTYPKMSDDDWCRLIVANKNGCVFYESSHLPILVEDPYAAWGTGRDFAYGALAMGADARKAVEIASQFSTTCGLGMDAVDL